jgi:hypothetical protein
MSDSTNMSDSETASMEVLPVEPHPTERALRRFVSNEMGQQRKTLTVRHLENCVECQTSVARFREIERRFRDFERQGIMYVGAGTRG